MKVFPDTNVLLSAFTARGLSSEVFKIILKEHELLVGDVVLEEFRRILLTKFKMPEAQVANLVRFLESFKIVPYNGEPCPISLRDPDDEKVLASAIACNAAVLLTGDKDLLDIRRNLAIQILNPREFLYFIR